MDLVHFDNLTAVHVLELVPACPGACPRMVWLKVYDDEVKVYEDVLCGCMPVPLSLCLVLVCGRLACDEPFRWT